MNFMDKPDMAIGLNVQHGAHPQLSAPAHIYIYIHIHKFIYIYIDTHIYVYFKNSHNTNGNDDNTCFVLMFLVSRSASQMPETGADAGVRRVALDTCAGR